MTSRSFRGTLFLSLLTVALVASAAKTVYQNDFATRTSAEAVPTADWHVKSYAYPASLCFRYTCAASALTPATPYSDPSDMQDGWIKGIGTESALANLSSGSLALWCEARTNTVAQYAWPNDVDNPYLTFYGQGGYNKTNESMAVHSIGNAFSTGTLRISADLRLPDVWHGRASFLVRPMFAKAMAPDNTDYDLYPLQFGFWNWSSPGPNSYKDSKGNQIRPIVNGGDPAASVPTKVRSDLLTYNLGSNYWRRIVVTMNLDDSTWTAKMYSLGTDQPLPGAAAGSETTLKISTGSFYRGVTDETGPISGLALVAYNINRTYQSEAYVYENAPKADNLKVEWKAPGTDEFLSCYENDFATCKYRTIRPTPVATAASPAGSAVSEDVFDAYPVGSQDALNADYFYQTVPRGGTYATGYLGDPGIDGWRRLNAANSPAYGSVHNWGGDGASVFRVVAAKNANQTGYFVNRFGKMVTSGMVRLAADVRLPDAWASTSREISVLLGGSGLYTATNATAYTDALAVRAGIGNATGTAFNPGYYAGTTYTTSDAATLTAKNWYRAVVTADLANQTYDYALYAMGADTVAADAEPSGAPVFSQTGIAFRSPVTDLATFGLYAASVGYSPAVDKAVLLDNVKVWTVDAQDAATLVYANDFKTRTAYGSAVAAAIVDAAPDRLGADGWFRRGAGFGRVEIAGADNRCLAFSPEKDSACVVHEFGTKLTSGRFGFTVDVRPPSYWTLTNGFAHVMLGGEEFFRGELGTASVGAVTLRNFEEAAAIRFGVGHNAGTSAMMGVFRESNGCAYSGANLYWTDLMVNRRDALWYRYAVKANLDTGKWSLKVYELGAGQPSVTTKVGTKVFEADGLDMCEIPSGGITSVGIKVSGCPAGDRAWAEAGGGALFDNLTVTTPEGAILILR